MVIDGTPKKSICEVMQKISREIALWLSHKPKAGEESLTDWLLYQTGLHASSISTMQFNKRVEGGVTGADWQWQAWFLTDSGCEGLRIQAKKLALNPTDNVNGLSYPKGTGKQMTLLLNDARRHKMRAAYAYYSSGPHVAACPYMKTDGVFLASAKDLQANFIAPLTTTATASAIIGRTRPLSCLFCCVNAGNSRRAVTQLIAKMFPNERVAHLKPPLYVTDFLREVRKIEARQVREQEADGPAENDSTIVAEFRRKHRLKLVRTFALTVFDLRTGANMLSTQSPRHYRNCR